MTYQQVADAVGKSKSTVYYHAQRMNIRPKFDPDLIKSTEAIDALAQES